jgi:hypothetical protein
LYALRQERDSPKNYYRTFGDLSYRQKDAPCFARGRAAKFYGRNIRPRGAMLRLPLGIAHRSMDYSLNRVAWIEQERRDFCHKAGNGSARGLSLAAMSSGGCALWRTSHHSERN